MFPLVKYFSVVSAIVVSLAMLTVAIVLSQITTQQLVEERQGANVSLTRIFASSVWNQFRDHVRESADLDGDALRNHATTPVLLRSVQDMMRGLSIIKVKVYALNGNTVFSTEAAQMGADKRDNPGFLSASKGRPVSEYSNRAKFSAFENEIFDVDVVSSYVPIRNSEGAIEAVFEVYDNVTATLQKMEMRKYMIIAAIGGLFLILYCALLLIVCRAARVISLQHDQLLESKTELEETNGQLSQRTQELENTQEMLVKQERLATLGELTATVSHELRNPLAAIRSSVHLVIKKSQGNDLGIQRPLERAERNVMRCDNIITDLLGYASEPECELEEVEGDDWVRTVLTDLETPDDIELVKRLTAPDGNILVAPERIRQAIVNIHENAVQALADTPKNKTRVLTVRTMIKHGHYKIAFQDNGPGLDDLTAARAFEPLFSTKSNGCGLGLATARKNIERFGGAVEMKSEVGTGTTVTISLPQKQKYVKVA